jgi:dihydrofolate reductase
MSKLTVHMSMSLDGFIAGPNPAPNNPLGDGGLKLHDWYFKDPENKDNYEFERATTSDTGAIIMGRVMYNESLPWWEGSGPMGDTPCFVLTEEGSEPEEAAKMFTFVTEGIEKALELATKAAGSKNVLINGGANTIQQYLKADLVDELTVHLVPILLGGGTSLFGSLGTYVEPEKVSVKDKTDVTHLTFRFKRTQ